MLAFLTPESAYTLTVYLFAALAVASSFVVAFSRDLARAIFMLLFALGSVAAFYALLGADFLFAVQLLVYVGGILVLLIFAMMISQRFPLELETPDLDRNFAGLITAGIVAMSIAIAGFGTAWPEVPGGALEQPGTTMVELGEALLTTHLILFEVAGIVLLVALLAATLLTRTEDNGQSTNETIPSNQ